MESALSIPIFDYREHKLPSGLIVPVSTMSKPEPFRSRQFVFTAEANGVRSKIFSVFFFRELGFFVHLGYFSPCHALLGCYTVGGSGSPRTTINLESGGKVSTHGFKYSHHASGEAHFSQSGQIRTEVKNITTPLSLKLGHVFTIIFGGIRSFAQIESRDKKVPSANRTVLNFRFDDASFPPGKVIGWWYPLDAVRVSEFAEGNPWQPKQVTLRAQDGRLLPGFLTTPPIDWGWSGYGLLLTVDPIRKPSSSLEAFLLFQGGVSVARNETGNILSETFIAAMFADRTDDLVRLTDELGTLDLGLEVE
jgi:hypothetical protein